MLQQQTQPAETETGTRWSSARRLGTLLDPRAALARAWAINRSLTLLGVLMLVTLAITLVGLLIDPRVITGAPAWLKPFKFAVSIAIYSFTLLWMLSFVQGRRRLVNMVVVGDLAGVRGRDDRRDHPGAARHDQPLQCRQRL